MCAGKELWLAYEEATLRQCIELKLPNHADGGYVHGMHRHKVLGCAPIHSARGEPLTSQEEEDTLRWALQASVWECVLL